MTDDPLHCLDGRRDLVRGAGLGGLDYVEVADDQKALTVHLIGPWPDEHAGQDLTRFVTIDGGRVIRQIEVLGAKADSPPPGSEGTLKVTLGNAGDFSTYTLRLARLDKSGAASAEPLTGFDPRYSCVAFNFKVNCPADVDCGARHDCPAPPPAPPEIDYLAKDYASFRRVILDRLAIVLPRWTERHAADLGVAIAELLAYAGDRLSYLQDAVATEAYLGTARRRISIRRHLRLIDYRLHEGCNARAWVHVAVSRALTLRPDEFDFVAPSRLEDESAMAPDQEVFEPLVPGQASPWLVRADVKYPAALVSRLVDHAEPVSRYLWKHLTKATRRKLRYIDDRPAGEALLTALLGEMNDVLRRGNFPPAVAAGTSAAVRAWHNRQALEAAFPGAIARAAPAGAEVRLKPEFNRIDFHLWGDGPCQLPRDATSAALRDHWTDAAPPEELRPRALADLSPGDFLLFEEVLGPRRGAAADADPARRHVVRLTRVEFVVDPVGDAGRAAPVALIEWGAADALPFSLCLAALGPAPGCLRIDGITVARGNIVLADHGETVPPGEPLGVVGRAATEQTCRGVSRPEDVTVLAEPFAPVLPGVPLTFAEPLPQDGAPAAEHVRRDPRAAVPAVWLWSVPPNADGTGPLFEPADPSAFSWVSGKPAAQPGAWVRQSLSLTSRPPATGTAAGAALRRAAEAEALRQWEVQPDLIGSGGDDPHVVLETDDEGYSHLRFGDGQHGREPEAGETYYVRYRLGNGPADNLPAGAIWQLRHPRGGAVLGDGDGVTEVRNPLPSSGGTEAQPVAEVKLSGRNIYRNELERAVTSTDYETLVQTLFPDRVQRAAASFRSLGTWTEVRIALDPFGTYGLSGTLGDDVRAALEPYRLIGHELSIESARYVPLRVGLHVCVAPGYERAHVHRGLLDALSDRDLPGGRRGFFHPDNLTFGVPVPLSSLIAAARAVAGVADVTVTDFRRQADAPASTARNLVRGFVPITATEVARLDNDPNDLNTGVLSLDLEGGR
jgi:hypothetical protein